MELIAIIKRVKELDSTALIASQEFRDYVEKQETEINRGISSLCILSIVMKAENKQDVDFARLQAVIDREMNRIRVGKKYKKLK